MGNRISTCTLLQNIKAIAAGLLVLTIIVLAIVKMSPRPLNCSLYYWKQTLQLNKTERGLIQSLLVNRLYVKYMDVAWDKASQQALPLAKIRFAEPIPSSVSIIPTVYITNNALVHTPLNQTEALAQQVAHFILEKNKKNKLTCQEVQFDCDWTDATQQKYFLFLNKMRELFPRPHYAISATIRLHQIKYRYRTGVPPVDRGMLMFYNMGKIDALGSRNSIYNAPDAAKYLNWVDQYPLPLDLALPLFCWAVHSRNGLVIGLVHEMSQDRATAQTWLKKEGMNLFRVQTGTFFEGQYFMPGDCLKIEQLSEKETIFAAQSVASHLPKEQRTVALYHLNFITLSPNESSKIENIFDSFR